MVWQQTLRRNSQGQIELKTTIIRQPEKDNVTVNIISRSEARQRLNQEVWLKMTDDSNGSTYMFITWEVKEPKPSWS